MGCSSSRDRTDDILQPENARADEDDLDPSSFATGKENSTQDTSLPNMTSEENSIENITPVCLDSKNDDVVPNASSSLEENSENFPDSSEDGSDNFFFDQQCEDEIEFCPAIPALSNRSASTSSESDLTPFTIQVRCLGSEPLEIEGVDEEMTILDLKAEIQALYNLDIKDQRILFEGKALPDTVNIPDAIRDKPSALQLIPFPKSQPNSDVVIKDVDDEINLLMNTSAEEVFDELENSQVPTIQQYLIDMFRRTMNEFDRDFSQYQDEPVPELRFPEPWEINIHDFRRAIMGLEQLSADHIDQLLNADDPDFQELSQFLLTFGTLFSSLSRLCCRVHPNADGDIELRRGVNVEQIIVVQTMVGGLASFDDNEI